MACVRGAGRVCKARNGGLWLGSDVKVGWYVCSLCGGTREAASSIVGSRQSPSRVFRALRF
eukprot:2013373-Rhodomonas_salina.1